MIPALFRDLCKAAHRSLRRMYCVFGSQTLGKIFSGQLIQV
jgi:hypothetical protein